MRPVLAITAAAVPLLTAAAACAGSPPAGTDGDLLDGWAMISTPAPFRPAAGECHETLTRTPAGAGPSALPVR